MLWPGRASEGPGRSTVGTGVGFGVISVTPTIGVETPGKVIWSAGVPGGTSSVTVIVWPPSSVTTNVRGSADAGSTAAPKPAENDARGQPAR